MLWFHRHQPRAGNAEYAMVPQAPAAGWSCRICYGSTGTCRWLVVQNMLWFHRHLSRAGGENGGPHGDGEDRQPGVGPGGGGDPHRQGDPPLHPPHHRCRRLPRRVLLHHRLHPRLLLARRCHLPHRHHRRQRSRRASGHRDGTCG